jgi:hypothetical protein
VLRTAAALALTLATAASAANYATAMEAPRPKTRVMGSRSESDVRIGPRALATAARTRKFSPGGYDCASESFGARYYDSRRARWISPDPALSAYVDAAFNGTPMGSQLAFPSTLSLYGYGRHSPITLKDADGNFVWFIVAVFVIGALSVNSDATNDPHGTPANFLRVTPAGAATLAGVQNIEGTRHLAGSLGALSGGDNATATSEADQALQSFVGAGLDAVGAKMAAGQKPGAKGSSALPDDALVCRGGTCTAERFAKATGATIDAEGKLQGVSVNSAPGKTVQELSTSLPQKQVGVTTVGKVRQAGGTVTPSPTADNPCHCTMSGITPQQAEQLFTPTQRNPNVP